LGAPATAILCERGFQVTAAHRRFEAGNHLKNQFDASAIIARRKLREPAKSRSNVRYADGIEAGGTTARASAPSAIAARRPVGCRVA
jgi:hypothetical protein